MLEQVGLEGQHLLHPQRPLLVPRPGQAERLVPGRQLHGPGPGVARERDAEHLEHDALHVVLGLGLGEAEGVHLHAVPEPPRLGIGDAVAVAGGLVPERDQRAHLAHLLDEPHAGVDEERDPRHHLVEPLGRHLAGVAHRVEHRDRGRHRERDLLHRCRAGLLQVVAADVDRVPARDARDGVGDQVGGQPHRLGRRERVGPAGEVLLDDVVLGGATELGPYAGRGRAVRLDPCLLQRCGLVEREQPHGGGVDGHRGVHRGHRDAVEQRPQVAEVADRHPDLADLAPGQLVVGVVAGLGRQVEGDRQAGLALGQVAPEQGVGLRRRGVTGVRPHDPGLVPHDRHPTGR